MSLVQRFKAYREEKRQDRRERAAREAAELEREREERADDWAANLQRLYNIHDDDLFRGAMPLAISPNVRFGSERREQESEQEARLRRVESAIDRLRLYGRY